MTSGSGNKDGHNKNKLTSIEEVNFIQTVNWLDVEKHSPYFLKQYSFFLSLGKYLNNYFPICLSSKSNIL